MKKTLSLFFLFFLAFSPTMLLQAAFVEFPAENTATSQEPPAAGYFNNVSTFFSFVLALVFILSICGLVLSGITFVMAGGHEGNLAKARTFLISSSVGLLISMVGYISLNLLKHFF